MRTREVQHLQTEKANLQDMMDKLSPERKLTYLSLQSRLEEIESRLVEARRGREPARALLTFQGPPVVDAQGIEVEFGTEATAAFTEVVSLVTAGLYGPLGKSKKSGNRSAHSLLITNIALGSFGFELVEHLPQKTQSCSGFLEQTAVAEAFEWICEFLHRIPKSDHEELAEAAAHTDPEAITKLRNFFVLLARHGAGFSLDFDKYHVECFDPEELRIAAGRLDSDIQTDEVALQGAFVGVLPHGRTFEFVDAGSLEIIRGRISRNIEDPNLILKLLDQTVSARLLRRFSPSKRVNYTLIEAPESQQPVEQATPEGS